MKMKINWFKREPEIVGVNEGIIAQHHIAHIMRTETKKGNTKPIFHVEFLYDDGWVDGHIHNNRLNKRDKR